MSARSSPAAFWVEFLRGSSSRGLSGVRLAITDQHEGLKQAVARVLGCPWQRCSVHFTRDMVMHCRRDQRGLVAAALREIFQAESGEPAKQRVTNVLERLSEARPRSAAARASRGGPDRVLRVPARALDQAAQHQPAGTRQQGDRPAL